ncbi:MAG: LCP family protein [Armatimonadota bacterium]
MSVLLVLLITAVAGGGMFLYCYITSHTIRDSVGAIITRSDTPGKAFPDQDQINVLLMGRDLDRDNHGQVVHTRGRTDCMMLAHIDFKKRSVEILSIPRDTLVRIPGYRGKSRVSYANALGGPELAQATVSKFLGVDPDYYLLVNFDAFAQAIDTIGGLNVTVDKKMDYDDNWGNLHIHLNPGAQVLNGEQAMGFVRYRKCNDGGGDSDFIRISRQQQILCAMREKFRSPGVIVKVPGIVDSIRDDMEGNLSTVQMLCLAKFMKSLPGDTGIKMQTLPALEGGGVFVRADLDATKELVRRIFFDSQQ